MFNEDIKKLARENENFRKVIYTGQHAQLVLMSLLPGEEIGLETHREVDQLFFFVKGEGLGTVNGENRSIEEHDVVFVPAGTAHNFRNTSDKSMKLFTVYAPPNHKDGTIHTTKAEAEKGE